MFLFRRWAWSRWSDNNSMVKINNEKRAITLIELIIATTITSAIFVLLFSLVANKLTAGAKSDAGTYYCWKDWNGDLYEKAPLKEITKVDECSIQIPKAAKNTTAYLIGGG